MYIYACISISLSLYITCNYSIKAMMINQFTYMQVANYNMNTPYILGQKKKKHWKDN